MKSLDGDPFLEIGLPSFFSVIYGMGTAEATRRLTACTK